MKANSSSPWISALIAGGLIMGVALPVAGQTQSAMNAQAGAELATDTKTMAAALRKLNATLSPEGRSSLHAAQASWTAYRDKECAFRAHGSVGGSVHGMAISACLSDLTRARTAELDQASSCPEGDVACGHP